MDNTTAGDVARAYELAERFAAKLAYCEQFPVCYMWAHPLADALVAWVQLRGLIVTQTPIGDVSFDQMWLASDIDTTPTGIAIAARVTRHDRGLVELPARTGINPQLDGVAPAPSAIELAVQAGNAVLLAATGTQQTPFDPRPDFAPIMAEFQANGIEDPGSSPGHSCRRLPEGHPMPDIPEIPGIAITSSTLQDWHTHLLDAHSEYRNRRDIDKTPWGSGPGERWFAGGFSDGSRLLAMLRSEAAAMLDGLPHGAPGIGHEPAEDHEHPTRPAGLNKAQIELLLVLKDQPSDAYLSGTEIAQKSEAKGGPGDSSGINRHLRVLIGLGYVERASPKGGARATVQGRKAADLLHRTVGS